MTIERNASLLRFNTFGIDAVADQVIHIASHDDLIQALDAHLFSDNKFFIIGGGSNLVFCDHFRGTAVLMQNKGIEQLEQVGGEVYVRAAAGENWDAFVKHCVSQGWHGLENLVAIPGTVGASPVQNVGAYGREAKDAIYEVSAHEIATGNRRIFANSDCRFGYRDSIFKNELKNKYIVESVTFKLTRDFSPDLNYKAVSTALEQAQIANPTAAQLCEVIENVRWSKLPRPEQMGSAGSFFKNPIVSAERYEELKAQYPELVAFSTDNGYKLAAGWLIEHTGWKGRKLGNCGVYEKQALVLVNHGGCRGSEVRRLAQVVADDVFKKFGVQLHCEAIFID